MPNGRSKHSDRTRSTLSILLKKNVWTDIIKTILEYPLMAVLEILREWKVVITLVGQGYESIESRQDYRTGTRMIWRKRYTYRYWEGQRQF